MGTQGTDIDAVLLSIAAELEQDWYDWEDRDPKLVFDGWATLRVQHIAKALETLKSLVGKQAE